MSASHSTTITLADEIYHYLWIQISSLQLKPGEKLSEARLAREFNCSRIPVREAVRLLVADGALDVQPQRGSFVSLIDRRQLERVRYLREVLECEVALSAFDEGTLQPILPYLESVVNSQKEQLALSAYDEAFRLDGEFHKIFYVMAHKEFVLEHTGQNDIHYMRARLLALRNERDNQMVTQHMQILDAIRSSDRTALREAFNVHLKNVNVMISTSPAMVPYESYFTPREERS
ncbi:MAG: GntR family transcriptional regulator [Gemmiger sp.]